jgi:ketosteroid isomerase-like protein
MSREKAELAREAWDALRLKGVGGLLPFLDQDVEWVSIPGFLPVGEDRRGHEGVVSWFEQIDELFEDMHWEAQEFVEAGDRLMIASRVAACGKVSGAPVEIALFHAVRFQDGKLVRLESFLRREQALKAVGLAE